MLKERKILNEDKCFDSEIDTYVFDGVYDKTFTFINEKDTANEINDEEFYYAEFKTKGCDSDYHTYCYSYNFEGVFLAFNLNIIDTDKYFKEYLSKELFNKN